MRFAMNVLQQFDPAAGKIIFKPPVTPAMEAARQATAVRVFLGFAQYPLWTATPLYNSAGITDVQVTDWRFPFGADALVDASNHVISSSFSYAGNTTASVK